MSSLATRGDTIAVAEFSYPGIFDIFDRCGVHGVPVRLDRAGMLPESLDDVLGRHRPAVLYFQAGPQIPTGQATSRSRIIDLAAVVDRHDVTVIEDTTLAGLSFDGTSPMLADHCNVATIVSTGSLSKTCWSGLRVGWIRGPLPIIEGTIYHHLGFDLGPSVPSQLLALHLLPHLDEITASAADDSDCVVDAAVDHIVDAIPEAVIIPPAEGRFCGPSSRSVTVPPS